jgi:hypothetical protein
MFLSQCFPANERKYISVQRERKPKLRQFKRLLNFLKFIASEDLKYFFAKYQSS